MLTLMYITNDVRVAEIADKYGVDRIFIDLETKDKELRQINLDTVKSNHSILDIYKIKCAMKSASVLVRVNHIFEDSEKEIDEVIKNGADIVMLPYFKTIEEVKRFISAVNKRAKTCLLLETPEAVEIIDDILKLDGIDEIHIGLNDLHLGYKKKFMFELLTDGTVENLCNKFRKKKMFYGFGGIAALGKGILPAEKVIAEHYRLGSQMAILSRSFCNTDIIRDMNEIESIFKNGLYVIRKFESELLGKDRWFFNDNKMNIMYDVKNVCEGGSNG